MKASLLASLLLLQSEPDRIPWTSSALHGTPDPAPPYRTEIAFPRLRFDSPVELVPVPGSDFLAVAERGGRILVFRNSPEVERPDLVVQLPPEVFGIAFHPRFAENRLLYVFHAPQHKRLAQVSRLPLRGNGPWTALPDSATAVIRWPVEGAGETIHMGGSLRFGPDGMLYVGVGDGSSNSDLLDTGQDLGDFFGSILRIDVDVPGPFRRYSIPRDNPFVATRGARPEIWAYGFRQPWKMSFDPVSGDLWVGDVGQSLWESVHRVRRGGNHGWSVWEGSMPYRPDRARGPAAAQPPVIAHSHTEFSAVIGGGVYRGTRLPELIGSYLYADIGGAIWEARLDQDRIVRRRKIARSQPLWGLGEDARGEPYVLHVMDGSIHRLVPDSGAGPNPAFPRRLSETGLFDSVRDHRPAPGVVPYQVNAPLWSDGAEKERLIALPGRSRIKMDAIPNEDVGDLPPSWEFPEGTVLVKTFLLGRRRIETRLLLLQKIGKGRTIRNQSWTGYSYRWNDDQTDAELVAADGEDVEYSGQRWRFPSRAECMMCHTLPAHFVLGVNTPQMNRGDQLERLHRLGLFDAPLSKSVLDGPRLVDYEDKNQDLERRARSYLHANCAHCHIHPAGNPASLQLVAWSPLDRARVVDVAPAFGKLGLPEGRLLAPGAPEQSVLIHRMGLTGQGRMPPISSHKVDEQGMTLVASWIRDVPPRRAPAAGRSAWVLGVLAAVTTLALAGYWWRRKSPTGSKARSSPAPGP